MLKILPELNLIADQRHAALRRYVGRHERDCLVQTENVGSFVNL